MASVPMDLILGRVLSALENEASLLGGVSEEIDQLKCELETMEAFLKDAEKKNGLTEVEKVWVKQVRDIAYNVEDIIYEYTYHVNSNQVQVGGQFPKFLSKSFYLPKNLWVRHQIATKLQKISKIVKAISERNKGYGGERIEGSSTSHNDRNWQRDFGEAARWTKEDDIVGIKREKELLMGWLMDGEPRLTSFSLVGMGGSGKTTLAAQIYNKDTLKQHFGCYAWITVSQKFDIDDLLRRLIKELYGATHEQIPSNLNSMLHGEMLELLVKYLKPRRYLVVLDDVWDVKVLNAMTPVFHNSRLGSRIIVTTRNEDVGSFPFGGPNRSCQIQPLSREESWTLFSNKAFSSRDNKSCPLGIEAVARELVERCKGLPLAIVALGGLMANKRTKEEWNMVLGNLSLELNSDLVPESVTKRILLLSFNDLPYQLKQCFLYCSLFPEDYCVKRKRLIRLWLAEGFVDKVNRARPEEVAEKYLFELISRSMLLVVERSRDGRPKQCKMHDLMRELALSISEREGFCVVHDGKQTLENHKIRRLSVQISDNELKSYDRMPKLRSLLVFVNDLVTALSVSNMLPSGLKLLRVLDLANMQLVKVPSELPYLFNLTYLNLRKNPIKMLPESIGNLCSLETLDIMDTQIEKLPIGIAKCKNLRSLIMYHYTGNYGAFKYFNGTKAPPDICKLKKLQVMACVEAEGDIIKRVGSMIQLTRIGITNVREEDGMNLCVSIQKLKLLRCLDLMAADEEMFLDIEALSCPPPMLKTLILAGKLGKVPQWFPSLKNITFLYLHWSRLTDDPLQDIGTLPCLAQLRLINAYVGESFFFLTGFVNLRRLYLQNFSQMTEIFIGKGVMPDLRDLCLFETMELKTIPCGIEYLTKLEKLQLLKVSEELVDRIRGEEAVDRPQVKHIPRIEYYYGTSDGMRYENLS